MTPSPKKQIHILISREGFNELKELHRRLGFDQLEKYGYEDWLPETYEEYLKKEEERPTMALFG